MKRLTTTLICLQLFLTICYPAGMLICGTLGYDLTLYCLPAFTFVLAVLSACLVFMCRKRTIEGKILQIILAATLPLSMINSLFCLEGRTALWLAIYVVACGILTVKRVKLLLPKITALVLSGLMVLPITFLLLVNAVFGNLGINTVVRTIDSPDGSHYAQVIDSDHGAMGGNTLVEVCEKPVVDNPLLRIQKEPTRVYTGDWGEYETMQIHWIDDHCLVINSVEYAI